MIKRVPSKDPNETLDYWIDYVDGDGDTIVSATWDIPVGLTGTNPTVTTTKATIWVSGGVIGTEYVFTGHIVTTLGRLIDQSFRVFVEAH